MSGDSKPVDGPVSRILNRRVASLIVDLIIKLNLPLTPNQMSFAAFLTALSASALIAFGWLKLGAVLIQTSSILDGVDGILARRRGIASKAGGFLDTMLDRYADVIIYGSMGFHLASKGVDPTLVALAVVSALSGDLLVSYLHSRGEKDLGIHPALVGPLDSVGSRDVRLFILALLTLVGRPLEALVVVAALSHSYVAVKSSSIYRLLSSERTA
ncbi:MAG: CDP-alcohol phosphatidyltransferase family protein [Aeropyrum sp.]|nr:CDP-alcohol phosphatidyltransferase family protein [Aeropyrum sp.]